MVGTTTSPALSDASQTTAMCKVFGPRSRIRLPGTRPISFTSTCAVRFTRSRNSP